LAEIFVSNVSCFVSLKQICVSMKHKLSTKYRR
jgi:hypothetical protein